MSIHLMSKAWRLDIPQGQKFLLVALCDYANDDGVCWPGQDSLCEKCSMSESTIGRHIKWLEDNGYLTTERRQKGRARLSDCYQINLEQKQEPVNLQPSNLQPCKLPSKNPSNCIDEPVKLTGSFNDESSVEPSSNHHSKTRVTRSSYVKKIDFDAESISWIGIEDRQMNAWKAAYPAVDLNAELAKAAAWLDAHPANRKSNYPAFLTRWFTRAQDTARPIISTAGRKPAQEDFSKIDYGKGGLL